MKYERSLTRGDPDNNDPQNGRLPDDEAHGASAHRHPLVRRALQIGRVALILAVLTGVVYAMISEWDGVVATFRRLGALEIIGAVLCVVVGLICGAKTWQQQLAAMGTKVKFTSAAQVNLVGQLGKYLGSGALAILLQAQLGKRFKIPRARALVALMIAVGISIVTALSLAVFIAARLAEEYGNWLWITAVGPVALVMVYPPLLSWIANVVLKMMRRVPMTTPMLPRPVAASVGWAYASWFAFGLHLWLVSGAIAHQTLSGFISCIAAMALAMAAGSVAFILPGGIGVREAIIVAALAPIASVQQALAIALASRILFSFGELASAGSAALISWRSIRRSEGADHLAEQTH